MSAILELISDLRDRGIAIWADGDELRYKTSSGPLTAGDVTQLRSNKQNILSLLATMSAEDGNELPSIAPVDREGPLVLSFPQQRLWHLLQLEEVSEAFHIPLALRLRGVLDERALRSALDRLVARHETLRTHFERVEGEGRQCIDPQDSGFSLRLHDLSRDPDAGPRLADAILAEVQAPFDLEQGPLARGRLLRLAPDDHVLLITLHHINADGWSMGILARELSAIYNALRQGQPDPLEPLSIQYADYAAWQRRLDPDTFSRHSTYWRETLAGAPSLLELPTDWPRPPHQEFGGGTLAVKLDETLTADLKALSQRHGTTLFMTLLAGWALVLSRLSGQDDIVIGTPTANRTRVEVEGLIGLFLNTLPLRIDLSGDPTVETLLSRTRLASVEAQEHQDLPFEHVVELVNPIRGPAHTPLFQVMFTWQNNDACQFDLHGLEATHLATPMVTAKYDLTLELTEAAGGISGILNYSSALFAPDTARRHVDYLTEALSGMVAGDQQLAGAVNLLPARERRRVLVEWNDTSAPFPRDRCIHELFEGQARRTPGAVAVVYDGRSMTYAELNGKANRLAWYLRGRGVGPDQIVAVCLERSTDLVVALLGVLKAGGAYLPLDPAYPAQRLEYMYRDAAPRILLTQERLRRSLGFATHEIVSVDGNREQIEAHGDTNPSPAALGLTSRHLAFVIYTSGSTGLPKAAMNEHRGMVNRIVGQEDIEAFAPDDICCQKTSISFVDAVFEIFGTLCTGHTLVIIPAAAVLDSSAMAAIIARENVTRLTTVPSLARSMLESDQIVRNLAGLRTWTLSGEEVRPDLVMTLLRKLPACEFIVQYGSSEVSSDATTYRSGHFEGERVPIGRPVRNARVYILDRYGGPVPIGVLGEIHVGGVGVGRGYLNRPELTQERFIPDPFSPDPQARLYKTGDLGRWRTDGTLECLGRNDGQVKIRGFRIELGEIEAQLARHPAVRQAVVIARDEIPGEKVLVAYVVTGVGTPPPKTALRAHLQTALPNHMVPGAFVILESLPLTPNGKLNRRALPAPGPEAYASTEYEPPRGLVEETLAGIWQQLLQAAQIGRQDNFFELGGHSLHGVKLITKVAESLGVRLPAAAIFQHPTLEQLARAVESLRSSAGAMGEIVASSPPSTRSPLAFSQMAHWRLYQLRQRRAIRHVASATRLQGPLNIDVLRQSLCEVVRRHDALRTRIIDVDRTPVQEIHDSFGCEIELIDLTAVPESHREQEVQRSIEQLILEPVFIAAGPLVGVRLLRLCDTEHVLIVAMEHMISDALSLQILQRDWLTAYTQLLTGVVVSLPAIRVQFPEYARWQRHALESWRGQHGAFWRERLKEGQRLRFPADSDFPAESRSGWAYVPLVIDKDLKAQLREWSRARRTTLVMSVFTAYVALMLRWCDAREGIFQYQIDGRSSPEVQNSIGYFATVLPLRIQLLTSDRFEDLLRRVIQEYARAHEHAGFQFVEAEVSEPVFARNTSFNWAPLAFDLDSIGIASPQNALRVSAVPFGNPALRAIDADAEPNIQLLDTADEVIGRLNFPANRFSSDTLQRFAGDFLALLRDLTEDTERR
ncbi:MAG: putative non ribosomal peptide synthetase protein [Gammaproteobacteria bacterium]|nr:putative non ribosomal peptide synthetase protein [Gammaproteobacteria bacterium]